LTSAISGQRAESDTDLRFPRAQVSEVVRLQRELILRVRRAAADPDVLNRLQEKIRARLFRELHAQPRDHLVGGLLALAERLQRDEHRSRIAPRASSESDDVVDSRIAHHDRHEVGELLAHRLERNALIGLNAADQPARVLLREKALRDDDVEVDVQAYGREEHEHDDGAVREPPCECATVRGDHRVVHALAPAAEPRRFALARRTQQPRAHHRRGRQRNDERDEDGDRERNRELAKQPADDSTHQQYRNEYSDQRQAHRQNGEADLARALHRRLERRHPVLDVTRSVLEDDDRVVHDEAGGDREGHQREVVDREAGEVHHAERSDQRHRHRDARNRRRPGVAQEEKDDEDHEHHGDRQRAADVAQAGADRRRALHRGYQRDRARDRRAQRWQQRVHPVDGVDDVGVRLAVDDDEHRRLAVRHAGVAEVLHRIDDFRDIRKAHRVAVAVRDDQRQIFGSRLRLVVRLDLPVTVAVFDGALRPIGVRGGQRGADILERYSVLVQRLRIQFHAHRRKRAAADGDLPDTLRSATASARGSSMRRRTSGPASSSRW
jgi:hypothetical protein